MAEAKASRLIPMLVFLLVICGLSLVFSLGSGSIDISLSELFSILTGERDTHNARVVMELRLPRVISGFVVGGLLALAGALMQVLLKNPLAEPYVLGVSGGASVFALITMMLGVAGAWLNISALVGALFSIFLVFGLAQSARNWNPLRVLLTGVVVAAGWGALVSFLLATSQASQLHGMLFWLMGDLEYARSYQLAAVTLVAGTLVSVLIARGLNLLAMGEDQALTLGVNVTQLRYLVYFLASLLTAVAVTQAGNIGFVGLIVPHLVRLLIGSDHRILLPVAVLAGGSLLVVADGLARTIIAPEQLPVGVLTALIGVPLFLLLLHRMTR